MRKQCVVAFLQRLVAQGPAGWVPSLHVTVARAPLRRVGQEASAAKKAEEAVAKNLCAH